MDPASGVPSGERKAEFRRPPLASALTGVAALALLGVAIAFSVQGHLTSLQNKALFAVTVAALPLGVALAALSVYLYVKARRESAKPAAPLNQPPTPGGNQNNPLLPVGSPIRTSDDESDPATQKYFADLAIIRQNQGDFGTVDLRLLQGDEQMSEDFVTYVLGQYDTCPNASLKEAVFEEAKKSPILLPETLSDAFLEGYLEAVKDNDLLLWEVSDPVRQRLLEYINHHPKHAHFVSRKEWVQEVAEPSADFVRGIIPLFSDEHCYFSKQFTHEMAKTVKNRLFEGKSLEDQFQLLQAETNRLIKFRMALELIPRRTPLMDRRILADALPTHPAYKPCQEIRGLFSGQPAQFAAFAQMRPQQKMLLDALYKGLGFFEKRTARTVALAKGLPAELVNAALKERPLVFQK